MSDTNFLRDVFKDILKHTHTLGVVEIVKVDGDPEGLTISSTNEQRTIIIQGRTHKAVSEFVDHTFGLRAMGVLDGMLNLDLFNGDNANINVATQERGGRNIPVELTFDNGADTSAAYRLMIGGVGGVDFRGTDYAVNFIPSMNNIKDLSNFFSILGGYEADFSPRTDGNKLYFHIGEANDRSKILISEDADGKLSNNFKYPLELVLKILKLGEQGTCVMSFSERGVIQIFIDSGIGEYKFLIPAKS